MSALANIIEFPMDLARQLTHEQEVALAKEQASLAPKALPPITSGATLKEVVLPLPAAMIAGILCQGEKGELVGGSKSFKTWTLIHQALCVAAGIPWWGFQALPNNVIFLNLEIPPPFFEARVRTVAHALGIDIPARFNVWHLRNAKLGAQRRWNEFLIALKAECEAISNPFLTSDPIYKLLGGRNENSAGDVAELLEQLDDMVEATAGANFFGHHYAKGNASTKEVIDRASGSGVFQRDPDSIFTMTAHEKEGAFTVDAILRNHEPTSSFVVRWRYPLFVRDGELDPKELKKPKNQFQQEYKLELFALHLGSRALSTAQLRKLMDEEVGMSKPSFYRLVKEAEKAGLIAYDSISKTWEKISRVSRQKSP